MYWSRWENIAKGDEMQLVGSYLYIQRAQVYEPMFSMENSTLI